MTVPNIHAVLRQRASLRSFGPDVVDESTLLAILEAARWAPSWGNKQPWYFLCVQDPVVLADLAGAYTRGNAWARQAPLIIAVVADPAAGKSRDHEPYYLFDCGLAVANLSTEAVSRGLISHPFAGWDETVVSAVLAVPGELRVVILVALGFPLPGVMLGQEAEQPRTRKALTEIVFADRWGIRADFCQPDPLPVRDSDL